MNRNLKEEKCQIFLSELIIYLKKCRDENSDNIPIISLTTELLTTCVFKRKLKFISLEKRMTEK
jgi:hypothetical protein